MTGGWVLDTSALLALHANEAGADRVEAVLRRAGAEPVAASFMTRFELLYRVEADLGREAALEAVRWLDATPLVWVSCEAGMLDHAARLKASGGISAADAWIAATALARNATLLHRDPEFLRVPGLQHERLPDKTRQP